MGELIQREEGASAPRRLDAKRSRGAQAGKGGRKRANSCPKAPGRAQKVDWQNLTQADFDSKNSIHLQNTPKSVTIKAPWLRERYSDSEKTFFLLGS